MCVVGQGREYLLIVFKKEREVNVDTVEHEHVEGVDHSFAVQM